MRSLRKYFCLMICLPSLLFVTCFKGNDVTGLKYESDIGIDSFKEVAESYLQWTGIAVSNTGRLFVNYPHWSSTLTESVAEIISSDDIQLYPDQEWNTYNAASPQNHFICVQSVYIDDEDFLWILDTGKPSGQLVVNGGAKLVKVNIQTNQVMDTILFDATIVSGTDYLNDVRVDTDSDYAYITESGNGAIIVVNLTTGESRRVLDNHFSTTAENIDLVVEGVDVNMVVHSDGIALNLTKDYLYYQALKGHSLYRIPTVSLRDETLTGTQLGNDVEFVADVGASDGIAFGSDGNLYLTSIEWNAIRRLTPTGNIEVVVQSDDLKWPDSMAITPEMTIYVTTSQIHLGNQRHDPYRVFKISMDE